MKLKCILFMVMLLFILSVSTVSANSDFVNETLSVDNSFLDMNYIQNFDDTNYTGSFDDLQNVINNASDNSIIYLDKDYNGCENSKIVLNKNLIIDGQGHTIDCLKKKNCFVFYSDNGQITLKNLVITNCRNYYSDFGGTIFISGCAQYCIENCTFMNNWVDGFGGAIYNDAINPLSIVDSRFIHNMIVDEGFGGAIYSKSNVNVKDSVFDSNLAYDGGGAIYCENDVNIIGCLFEKNSCSCIDSYGGAINSVTVSVSNSIFRNNRAIKDGGAIYTNQIKTDSCSYFENNQAVNGDGGAIYTKYDSKIKNSSFVNNKALNKGGAVYCENDLSVNNVSFRFNSVDVNGGAIYCKNANIIDSVFESNKAQKVFKDSCGGAVFTSYNVVIDSSVFINNYAEKNGGALFSYSCIITNSLFENNSAAGNGGAVACEYTWYYMSRISSSYFVNNNANFGGAIDIINLLLESSYFANNSAVKGGAVHSQDINIISTCFEDNFADYGGAIFSNEFSEGYSSDFYNVCFINNHAVFGGALYIDRNINYGFTSCVFINNTADDDGGAIYNQFIVDVKNCSFVNNRAQNRGGAIYNNGKMSVCSSSFVGNYADYAGGAIYSKNSAISSSYFAGNTARVDCGGGVFSDTFDSDIVNLTFINNSAGSLGGGLFINKLHMDISHSYFITNRAGTYGCALYIKNVEVSRSVTYSSFINNGGKNCIYVENQVITNPEYIKYWEEYSKLNFFLQWIHDNLVSQEVPLEYAYAALYNNHDLFLVDSTNALHIIHVERVYYNVDPTPVVMRYTVDDSIHLNEPFKVKFYVNNNAPRDQYDWSAFDMNNVLFNLDEGIVLVSKEVGDDYVTLELIITDESYKEIGVSFYGCSMSIPISVS